MSSQIRSRPTRRRSVVAILARAVTFCRVIPAAAQYSVASVGAGQATAPQEVFRVVRQATRSCV